MDVTCERCGTEYEFDETLLSSRGTSVKCTNCGHVFKVYPTAQAESDRATSSWRLKLKDGSIDTIHSLRELQRRIGSGELEPANEIARGDESWKTLGSIPELETFFQAAGVQVPPAEVRSPVTPSSVPPAPQSKDSTLPPGRRPRQPTLLGVTPVERVRGPGAEAGSETAGATGAASVPESVPEAASVPASVAVTASAPEAVPVPVPASEPVPVSEPEPVPASVSVSASVAVTEPETVLVTESVPAPQPVTASIPAPAPAYDRQSLPEPLPQKRQGGWGVWLLAAALGLGAYALATTGALDTLLRPAAPAVAPAPSGIIDVAVTPADAQIFVFVGRGPAVASGLAVGDAHEFIVLERGLRPSRAIVPEGATWTTTDHGSLFELAVQAQTVAAPADALDFGSPGPTAASAKADDSGTIRIITNPQGAKVYRFIGVGPTVSIPAASIHEGQEVLVYHPQHEARRAVIGPSDWQAGEVQGTHSASLEVHLPPVPALAVPEALED
jgi:predicted Zn finger-like uncharacterized protein